jgi:CheY-like chemotaxis protein
VLHSLPHLLPSSPVIAKPTTEETTMPTPLRVLFLEDAPEDMTLLLRELRRAGFEPTGRRVETQAEYLAALDPPPDVIFSDYNLPEFTGLDALRLLRQRGADVPFLMVSGTTSEDVTRTALREGADDCLRKDRLACLGPAVRRALEQRRHRQERRSGGAGR